MVTSRLVRTSLAASGAAAGLLVVFLLILGLCVQAGYLRQGVIGLVERSTGRRIEVAGPLRLVVFATRPTLHAERVRIGNPPWVAVGRTADVATLDVEFDWPGLRHGVGIRRLTAGGLALFLTRDAAGNANWQWTRPHHDGSSARPIIRGLTLSDIRLRLDDQRRHLLFDGQASVLGVPAATGAASLRLEATGVLNGHAAAIEIVGDGLDTASHERPYRFRFREASSGSVLTGSGALPRPFDLRQIDASFSGSGADLKDLYFLTGVTLLNTAPYTLSGQISLRDEKTAIRDLKVASGSSDVQGSVTIDSSSGRPKLDALLQSKRLRLADLGLRAAGREAPADDPPRLLLSNAGVRPSTFGRLDSAVRVHAERLDVGRVPLRDFDATASVDRSVLTVPNATAEMLGGRASGRLRLDATQDPLSARLEIRLDAVRLEKLARDPGNPPIEGPLSVRAELSGSGNSLHQAAAGAEGTVTAALPSGSMRSALAELAGLDLRGLGLALSHSGTQVGIRCGVGIFNAVHGTLIAQRLVLDTDSALITGEGSIHLDTETLDLQIHGTPKHLRILRLDAPLAVQGTLLHPSLSIASRHSALRLVQTGPSGDDGCAAASAAAMHTIETEHNSH